MSKKSLINTLIVTLVIVALVVYLDSIKKQGSEFVVTNVPVETIKKYKNEKHGYEIQYPSYFTLYDSKPDSVSFVNKTCESNTKLCIHGIDGIGIDVSENLEDTDIDQMYQYLNAGNSLCKQFSIYPLPENFNNQNEWVRAIRCEFKPVPKQAKGGYTYTILKDDKIFSLTMSHDDFGVLGYINGMPGLQEIVSQDAYDPIGDMMMRTFKFAK